MGRCSNAMDQTLSRARDSHKLAIRNQQRELEHLLAGGHWMVVRPLRAFGGAWERAASMRETSKPRSLLPLKRSSTSRAFPVVPSGSRRHREWSNCRPTPAASRRHAPGARRLAEHFLVAPRPTLGPMPVFSGGRIRTSPFCSACSALARSLSRSWTRASDR